MSDTGIKLELYNYQNYEPEIKETAIKNKFVLMTHRDIVALVMGPVAEYPYHAALVEKYCNDNDIPASWIHKPDLLEIFDEEVKLKGGGQLDIYPQKKVLKIYGFSTAYGPYSTEYLKKFLADHPFFTPYSVRVKSI